MNQKVSIIIPAYNAAPFIERTVESIRKQVYPNWELIIVNDGSKDDTAKVIDTIAANDSRIKAVHQENGGEVSARHTGTLHADGEWVMYVDADDMLPENSISSLMQYADKGADIIVGTMHIQNFDADGNKFEDYVYQNKLTGLISGIEYACGEMTYKVQIAAWGKLYRLSMMKSFPWCIDRTIRQNPDLLMNIGLGAYADKVYVSNDPVYEYLIHEGTASSGVMPFENWMRLFDEAEKYIVSYPQPELLAEAFFRYRMERFDAMLRHGVNHFPTNESHVLQALQDCKRFHLTSDERKVRYLLLNIPLRKMFWWWQKSKYNCLK